MKFNYENIYLIERLKIFDNYVSMMIQSIFDVLYDATDYNQLPYPLLKKYYQKWVEEFNNTLYNYDEPKDKIKSILDFIAGMTDQFLIRAFNELISFH